VFDRAGIRLLRDGDLGIPMLVQRIVAACDYSQSERLGPPDHRWNRPLDLVIETGASPVLIEAHAVFDRTALTPELLDAYVQTNFTTTADRPPAHGRTAESPNATVAPRRCAERARTRQSRCRHSLRMRAII
jgi:hypothetical protein